MTPSKAQISSTAVEGWIERNGVWFHPDFIEAQRLANEGPNLADIESILAQRAAQDELDS